MKSKSLVLIAVAVIIVASITFIQGCSLTVAEQAIETFIQVEEALFAEEVAEDVVEDMKEGEKGD